jgi:hypothetical protein
MYFYNCFNDGLIVIFFWLVCIKYFYGEHSSWHINKRTSLEVLLESLGI